MMNVRVGRISAIVSVSAAVLMVCSVPAFAAAEGIPTLAPGSPHTVWAYGAARNVSFQGIGHSGWAYSGTALFGYSVILHQTNTSATSFELSVNRTMGAKLSVGYCPVTCKGTTPTVTLSYHEWEATNEWANFTTAGTVYENGAPVAAVALNNSHTTVAGSLFDTAKWPLRHSLLAINVTSSSTVNFTTPLGLLPDNLATGESWNDSSDYTASGGFLLSYFYNYTGALGGHAQVGPGTVPGLVTSTGSVAVVGSSGIGTTSLGGSSYNNVSLTVLGPFAVREGFILVPSQANVFGGLASGTPTSNATGGANAEMTAVYAEPLVGGHLGIIGSAWTFESSASNPQVSALVPGSSGVAQLGSVDQVSTGADQLGSTSVEGVPMNVDSAQTQQGCLIAGDCQTASGSPARPLTGLIAVLVVSTVVVVAIVSVVATRRRVPPPANLNAGLYPPIVRIGGSAPPPATAGNPPPPPPAEEDPLAHLW
jgi:hypothetical protein